jgi:AraC-like DNA-binding protein
MITTRWDGTYAGADMPQIRDRAFSDPYALAATIRGSNTDFVVTSKGDFAGHTTLIDFDRLWLSQIGLSSPSLLRAEGMMSKRALLIFPAAMNERPFQFDRTEVSAGEVLALPAATTHYYRTPGPFHCATMTMTHDELAAAGQAIAGRDLSVGSETRKLRPPTATMRRLTALHDATVQIARTAPDVLANPSVAHALEQELIHAMVTCLNDPAPANVSSERVRHQKIMARFEDFLAMKRYEPLYLAEICAGIGASERTLRACCHEHLGVGPVRYLWLRRMNLAHRKLLRCDATEATVTEIATEHGFWELGRFSGDYRALFGELPSVTLERRSQGIAEFA